MNNELLDLIDYLQSQDAHLDRNEIIENMKIIILIEKYKKELESKNNIVTIDDQFNLNLRARSLAVKNVNKYSDKEFVVDFYNLSDENKKIF